MHAVDWNTVLKVVADHSVSQGPVSRKLISLMVDDTLKLPCHFVSEYETDSPPKRLHCKFKNQTNGPGFSSYAVQCWIIIRDEEFH